MVWISYLSISNWGREAPPSIVWSGWAEWSTVARNTARGELWVDGGRSRGAETQHTLTLQGRQLRRSRSLLFFLPLWRRGLYTYIQKNYLVRWTFFDPNMWNKTLRKLSLTCVSEPQQEMLFRGYSDSRWCHSIFEIFPEVKKSVEAEERR